MPAVPLRVALLGLGTVGAAVASRLVDTRWRADVEARGSRPLELVIGVRDPGRERPVALPAGVGRTDDLTGLVERDDVDIVVELLGGLEPAGELIERALSRGKAVVTANKALLAEAGPALERAARRRRSALRFEAAVGAGIPILAPLARDLAANQVDSVRGIVNGTTNFILSAMDADETGYSTALADAQRRGYAEADPSADVEARDAAHKLVLLARLAFGAWIQPSAIRRAPAAVEGDGRPGITGISASEVAAARESGLALKLVARVERASTDAGSHLVGSAEPVAVARASGLGSTAGVTNFIEVTGSPVGRVVLQGAGAGGDATSSAVLADVLAVARGEGSTWGLLPEAPPLGELDDGASVGGRWFCVLPDGPRVTDKMPLAAARQTMRDAGAAPTTSLYRVLEAE